MALTMYLEARSEGYDGLIAVGSVILNRAKQRGLSIKQVCLQPFQFSCFNENDPQRAQAEYIADDFINSLVALYWLYVSLTLAQWLIAGSFKSNIGSATNYYNPAGVDKKPEWVDKMRFVTKINHHWFYV